MFLLFLFILGLAIGSFLNVCIDRLSKDQSILGRSKCDHCRKKIESRDLIPVLSFMLLRGRCRFCKKKLSFYYPLVELLTGITFVLVWLVIPAQNYLTTIAYIGIFTSLIGIFFADLKYQIIPDEFQVALLLFSALFFYSIGTPTEQYKNALVSGLIVLSPIYFLYLVTDARGMGFGDVKLSFIIGFLFGSIAGILAVYLGFVTGALVGLILLLSGRRKWRSKIAFGPFLVIGSILVLIFFKEMRAFIQGIYGL